MEYRSTRDVTGDTHTFCEILLEGLAPDGGLYLPVEYPEVDYATLEKWRGLSYPMLAFRILSLYMGDIPPRDLYKMIRDTYSSEVFGSADITPMRRFGSNMWFQNLSNGPTKAFKDVALQLLGRLFEYELARRGETLNILGATSGDTGSAAEYAMRGRRGISVFMLSPLQGMSDFQQAQMYSIDDPNIHNLVVFGNFDDAQAAVKAVSADLSFKREMRIGTVNSINWARLLAQVVYYFWGYFRSTETSEEEVNFAIPSGNFGNAFAGHVAKMMGLPIHRLMVGTNENNVLEEFFRTGRYKPRAGHETFSTSSPSMDISKASNFERLIADLLGRDGGHTAFLFGDCLRQNGEFGLELPQMERLLRSYGFVSSTSSHYRRISTIRAIYETSGIQIDPHTADGVVAALEHDDGLTTIAFETALPLKFENTMREALGPDVQIDIPEELRGIEKLQRKSHMISLDPEGLKSYIRAHTS